MYKLKKLILILLLGVMNFYIMITNWANIKNLDILLNILFIISNIAILYLGYQLFCEIDRYLKRVYKNSLYRYLSSKVSTAILFLAIFLGAIFIDFIVSIFSPRYLEEYNFHNKKFSIYDSSFMDYCADICINDGLFRKNLIGLCNEYNLSIFEKNGIVYLKTKGRGDIKIYDLNSSKKLYYGE